MDDAISVFDFVARNDNKANNSFTGELDSAMTLCKYAMQKTLQVGNEQGFMLGTYLNETNMERFKMHLVSEYKSQGDSFH